MWFVFLVGGLTLLAAAGVYVQRRLTGALGALGASPRVLRGIRWVLAWLLAGFPALILISVVLALALGWSTIPRLDGLVAGWLLAIPFTWAVLVVFQAAPWLIAIDLAYLVARRRGVASAARLRAIGGLVVIAAFAIYTPARIVVDRGDLRVRHHALAGRAASPGAPALRIAFLADVQQDAHTDGARAREVYAEINATAPDLVLSGGDWINTGPDSIAAAAEAAGTLRSRLGTFSVRGDHEHFAYRDRARSVAEVEAAMRRHGVTMLDDEVRWFEHRGKRIGVVFLGYNYLHKATPDTVRALVAEVADADYAIVVTHQLDRALAAQLDGKVDLVLAGHTHGGQVNPVVGVTHVALARLETPYVDGRYALGPRTTAIVTAGIGTSIVPVRYAAPGSVEIIDLRP